MRFYGFETPQLDSAGQVVFAAGLAGDDVGCTYNGKVCNFKGLWKGNAASLSLVMRGGEQAGGLPTGVLFTSFNEPNLSVSSGEPLAFQAGAVGPDGTEYGGIFSGSVGSLDLVVSSSDHAPGTPPDFGFVGYDGPGHFKVNSSGESALSSGLFSATSFDEGDGIWSSRTGTLELIARDGDHAPGMPADVRFDGVGEAALNPSGYVVFSSVLSGTGFGYLHNTSIWSDRSGSLALIASANQPAPGTDSGVVFRGVDDYPKLDTSGHVSFLGWLSGPSITSANDNGIWSDVSGSLSPIVRTGEHAPGLASGVNFHDMSDTNVFFNGSGKTAFASGLSGPGIDGTNNYGIWSNASGAFRAVARMGDAAPGGNGKVFGSFGDVFFNDAGQVAFQGYLSDPAVVFSWSFAAIDGLWAEDRTGKLHLIVLKGGQIEVVPGDVRTVESFEYVNELNGDGSPSAFNSRGEFAFLAQFTDGTSGIFVSDVAAVPEPSCAASILALAIVLAGKRRRCRKNVASPMYS